MEFKHKPLGIADGISWADPSSIQLDDLGKLIERNIVRVKQLSEDLIHELESTKGDRDKEEWLPLLYNVRNQLEIATRVDSVEALDLALNMFSRSAFEIGAIGAHIRGAKAMAKRVRSEMGRKGGKLGAEAKHGKPGGSRDKQQQIRAIWASGRYDNRDRCAEQECGWLGMSLSSARKALVGTADHERPLAPKRSKASR